jgi:hypothetical protein
MAQPKGGGAKEMKGKYTNTIVNFNSTTKSH